MPSTPRASSPATGTFAAGQGYVSTFELKPRGPLKPSAGHSALAAPAGQREPQAADGTERGPRVVADAPGGDQRAGAAGPPGHEPRGGHGEPRPGDEQPDDDQREAGRERLDLPLDRGRVPVHLPEAEL